MEYWGNPGLPFAMVQCLHQSKDYIKRKVGVWGAQICIPVVGATRTLTCAGSQSSPNLVRQYRAENGLFANPGLPFAMVQCLYQSIDYIRRKLGLWRAQKCNPPVGAISVLTCAGPQTTPTHEKQDRTENGIFGKSGLPFAMVHC